METPIIIAIVAVCILLIIIIVTVMVIRSKKSAGSASAPSPPVPVPVPAPVPFPAGCNIQPTNSIGDVICPPNYNTKYNYGVNVAADCDVTNGLCNRCVGTAYPTAPLGFAAWPNTQWLVFGDSRPAKAIAKDGKVMSYSGTYVTDAVPIPSSVTYPAHPCKSRP
jgi:hypothetical protein